MFRHDIIATKTIYNSSNLINHKSSSFLSRNMTFLNVGKCFSEPKHLVRLLVITLCLGIAMYQLSECFRKIQHPPVSTHYMFRLNQSMRYPSLTLCRHPPYKSEVLKKYGLPDSDPFQTSIWMNFSFDNFTLDDFVKEATFSLKEVVAVYGFAGYKTNIEVTEFTKLSHGRCFMFSGKNVSEQWEKGYLLYLKHIERPNQESTVGFNIFIQEPSEMITEYSGQSESFMEQIYVESGEDLTYSLRTNEYNQLPSKENNCTEQFDYSRSKCRETCLHEMITSKVGCSAPWFENDRYNRCDTYQQMKDLITDYNSFRENIAEVCDCPSACRRTIYMPYVQRRKEMPYPGSILAVSYTSNLVTVMEEVTGYDWSLFLADLGGSLGFLLGLSVLGFIGILEQILKICLMCCCSQEEENVDNRKNVERRLNGNKINVDDLRLKENKNLKK